MKCTGVEVQKVLCMGIVLDLMRVSRITHDACGDEPQGTLSWRWCGGTTVKLRLSYIHRFTLFSR